MFLNTGGNTKKDKNPQNLHTPPVRIHMCAHILEHTQALLSIFIYLFTCRALSYIFRYKDNGFLGEVLEIGLP